MKKLFQIILITIVFKNVTAQQSCSEISRFYSDLFGVYGQVQIAHVPLQQITLIEIMLTVAARLPSNNDWRISLSNPNPYNDLVNDRGLTVKFVPLVTNPFPIVTAVYLNGNQICSSHPARGNYVSTIKLSYTYTVNNIPKHQQTKLQSPPTQTPYIYPQTEQTYMETQNPFLPYKESSDFHPSTVLVNNKFDDINLPSNQEFVCGVRRKHQNVASFIIGGQKGKNDFPWLAAFYYGHNGFICGGSLLSTRIVVTAAHCVQNKQNVEKKNPYDSTFYLGKYNLKDLNELDYVNSGVDSFIIHPEWNPFDESYEGDLCVVVLTKVIKFNNNIVPLCIWPQTSSHQDLIDKQGLIAGWGITEKGTISEVPMFITLPVVDDATCLRSNEIFSKITTSTTFCVGDKSGRSPCNGDSGGAFAFQNPTDHKYYFRGIVSSGIITNSGSCDTDNYAIFTDIAQFSNWIFGYVKMYE